MITSSDINWLKSIIPNYFPHYFDYRVEREGSSVVVTIYSDYTVLWFRECRHELCDAVRKTGRNDLYNEIQVFQRRSKTGEEVK